MSDLYKKERKEKNKNWWVMGINHRCITKITKDNET